MTRRIVLTAAMSALLVAAAPAAGQEAPANRLTAAERAAGWRLLFDGEHLDLWRGYRSDSLPPGWHAEDGLMIKAGSTGDIVTRELYGDFELALEWRLEEGGNAGLFYRATEEEPKVYWTGPEYQLLDDARHPDGRNRLTAAGADYGLYPAPEGIVRPGGEWNRTRIVVAGNHVEHWLNGTRLLSYELHSEDWKAKVAASKFSAWPRYGMAARGHIAVQGDHNGELALRNVKIRVR